MRTSSASTARLKVSKFYAPIVIKKSLKKKIKREEIKIAFQSQTCHNRAMTYHCTKCDQDYSKDGMSKDCSRRDGISSWCKKCRATSTKQWARKYPEKVQVQKLKKIESRECNWRTDPKGSYIKQRDAVLRCRYGISLDQYDEMLSQQGHQCAICHKDARKMTYMLHVDHCHESGIVRGLLCAPCNVYLGAINDNPDAMKRGAEYLSVRLVMPK